MLPLLITQLQIIFSSSNWTITYCYKDMMILGEIAKQVCQQGCHFIHMKALHGSFSITTATINNLSHRGVVSGLYDHLAWDSPKQGMSVLFYSSFDQDVGTKKANIFTWFRKTTEHWETYSIMCSFSVTMKFVSHWLKVVNPCQVSLLWFLSCNNWHGHIYMCSNANAK